MRRMSVSDVTAKITVVLLDRHVAYLDRIAVDIRYKHGVAIARAEIIRALVDAASSSKLDLASAANVPRMTEMLREAWARKQRRR
jgi:hypothetical protein